MLARLAVAAALVAALVGSPVEGAGGATSGSVTITPPTDTVLYRGCYEYPYSYSVVPPSSDWTLDITLEDPYGAARGGDLITDSDPASGTGSFFLCGGTYDFGTYTIKAVFTWYDANYNKTVEPTLVTTFTLGKPATRTRLTASTTRPTYNAKVVFKVRSAEQQRLGYAPLSYVKVRLETYARGAWRKVDATTSDDHGITKFRYRWDTRRPAVKVRAVTLGTPELRRSASTPITVRVQ